PAWRLFFERMAESKPVVMVFEDLQWADVSLLDFLAYLLEWSRQHPIYVLCLARPELLERHPDFAKASRNATMLSLEPLSPHAMEALLDGFVPGLPDVLRTQILLRVAGAEGGARAAGRPALARARSVRIPAGPRQARRLRDPLEARAEGAPPGRRRLPRDVVGPGRARDRRGRRLPLPGGLRGGARR